MRRSGVFLSLLIASCGWLQTQAEQLVTRTFNSRDGLPDYSNLADILQDSRGFIWLATRVGVSRFDGQQFQTYAVRDGLGYPAVNAVIETRSHEIWAATNGGGAARYQPNAKGPESRFLRYATGDTSQTNAVNSLAEGPDGTLYAATDGGVFRLKPGATKFEELFRPPRPAGASSSTEEVTDVYPADGGALLIASNYQGLFRRNADGSVDHWESIATYPSGRFYRDHSGHLWLLTGQGGVLEIDPKAHAGASPVLRRLISETVESGPPRRMIQTRRGDYWITSVGGLIHFDGQRTRLYGKGSGLPGNPTSGLAEDPEGNVWVGVDGEGLVQVMGNRLTGWSVQDGLAGTSVIQVFARRNGSVLALTGNESGMQVQSLDGKVFRSLTSRIPSQWVAESLMLQDRREDFWIAGDRGVQQFHEGSLLRLYGPEQGWPAGKRVKMFEDHEDSVWVSRYGPNPMLVRWRRGAARPEDLTRIAGSPAAKEPWQFTEDRDGNLFLATVKGGVFRYREGRFLEVNSPFSAGERHQPTVLHTDESGRTWVGYTLGRLGEIVDASGDHPALRLAEFGDKSSQAMIYSIANDRKGRLYVGTLNGLYLFDPHTGRTVSYRDLVPVLSGRIRSAVRDAQDNLWFGTDSGLVRMVPGGDTFTKRPEVRLTQARFFDTPWPMSDWGETAVNAGRLDWQKNRAEFSFSGLGELVRLRYRYRLEPQDVDWSAPTSERTVIYPRLPSGAYRFAVQAIDPAGNTSANTASFGFEIAAPVWQRPWFIALVGLTLAAALTVAYRLRVRYLLSVERLRTRIATDLHDDIGSSLSQVAILSELTRRLVSPGETAQQDRLERIGEIVRNASSALADCVWTIDPHHDSLGELTARMRRLGNDLLTPRDVAFRFESAAADDSVALEPNLRRQLFLIYKEALNNVVRHSGAKQVSVRIDRDGSTLEMVIEDDGVGFDAENRNGASGNGLGLRGMRERAQQLKGSLEVCSRPGEGTRLELRLPFSRHGLGVGRG